VLVPCPGCRKRNRIRLLAAGQPTCGHCRRLLPLPVGVQLASLTFRLLTLRAASYVVVLAVCVLFATLVWPTRWEKGDWRGFPTRTDRLSGKVEVLGPRGWQTLARAQ
jgi:hypothetical protein